MTPTELAEAFNAEKVEGLEAEAIERLVQASEGGHAQADLPSDAPATPPSDPSPSKVRRLLRKANERVLQYVTPEDLKNASMPEPLLTYQGHVMAHRGEFISVAGDPGVGKSFLLLEMATCCGRSHFAGMNFTGQRVLWIDEEGAHDILKERLHLLRERLSDTMRFYVNQDLRLDDFQKRADLFREVEDFEPDIIVIDSATRVHSLDENNAGEMARLYNEALKPLSRTYGATVFLIDHTRKQIPGQAPIGQQVRGSMEKVAQIDRSWLLRKKDAFSFTLEQPKVRRGLEPPRMVIRRDTTNGCLRHLLEAEV